MSHVWEVNVSGWQVPSECPEQHWCCVVPCESSSPCATKSACRVRGYCCRGPRGGSSRTPLPAPTRFRVAVWSISCKTEVLWQVGVRKCSVQPVISTWLISNCETAVRCITGKKSSMDFTGSEVWYQTRGPVCWHPKGQHLPGYHWILPLVSCWIPWHQGWV